MEFKPEDRDRLRKIALTTVPLVLGTVAIRNIHQRSQLLHVSYWEASQSFIIDLIEDGKAKTLRLSGQVIHGPNGRDDLKDIEIEEGFDYSDDDISRMEQAAVIEQSSSD